jgi:hypothetical protein
MDLPTLTGSFILDPGSSSSSPRLGILGRKVAGLKSDICRCQQRLNELAQQWPYGHYFNRDSGSEKGSQKESNSQETHFYAAMETVKILAVKL